MKLFYSLHARERMIERYISHEEVMQCLEHGVHTVKESGEINCVFGKVRTVIEVDTEQDVVVVITVIPSKSFSREIRKYMKAHRVSYRVATKELKQVG